AVPVVADARHDAACEVGRPGMIETPEAERVHDRDRARTHREHVAQDATDTGRRALKRLHERRMVVALDLEDGRETVADVDRACVLARSLQHLRAGRRKLAKPVARALVRAVLRPHDTEDRHLLERGCPPEALYDALVLLGREALPDGRVDRDGGTGHGPGTTVGSRRGARLSRPTHACMERKSFKPSSPPSRRSAACSGCGIMPTTLRPALHTPAMLLSEPFGFTSGVVRPLRSA